MKNLFIFIFLFFISTTSIFSKNFYISKNVANIHILPQKKSEVGSQAIYGTFIKILKEEKNWSFIQTPDKYLGWVLRKNIISKFSKYLQTPIIGKVNSLWAHIHFVEDTTPYPPIITLPFDTRVEVLSEEDELSNRWIKVKLLDGKIGFAQSKDFNFDDKLLTIDEMVKNSKNFLNIPYYWGGCSSFGFDCAGFTQMLYKQMGINIAKDSFNQAENSNLENVDFKNLKKGDLVFFSSNNIRVTHVGLYLGRDEFIHAGTKNIKPIVQISKLSTYPDHFIIGKRSKKIDFEKSNNLPPIYKILEKPSGEVVIGDFVGQWWNPLPEKVKNLIDGLSFKEGAISIEDLAYVQITHFNADNDLLKGELIFHKNLAREIVDIFLDLYKAKYPIEKVRLIDHYNANDEFSMNNNNSSALCVRPIENTTRYSYHSYGGTIDINPIVNPYARGSTVLPTTSKDFLDRERDDVPGLIKEGDVCYQAFVSRGYEWGGHWTSLKDYQHFEKKPKQFMDNYNK